MDQTSTTPFHPREHASAAPRVRVAVIDDHEVVREGLRMSFDSDSRLTLVGNAGTAESGRVLVRRSRPHVVVVDLRLPDMTGIELCSLLLAEYPRMAIVLHSTYLAEDVVREATRAGAAAYVTKAAGISELRGTIMRVAAGERMTSGTAMDVVGHLAASDPSSGLTPRQARVAELLLVGETYSRIGGRLHISEATVRWHVQKLKERFDVTSRSELIATLVRTGAVLPDARAPIV